MITLDKLFKNTGLSPGIQGSILVKDIVYDSRKASADVLFVCIKGYKTDGHDYAREAYKRGVRFFVASKKLSLPNDATVYIVENTRRFLAVSSANLFANPAKKLILIGVTGTKGKTSTSFMLKSILEASGIKTGIMGSIGVFFDDKHFQTEINTPESYYIHKFLSEMKNAGCRAVIIETSSQGFMLDRTFGIPFEVGIFTNISPDHIGSDEHRDFAHYMECKRILFDQSKVVIINTDMDFYIDVVKGYKDTTVSFGINEKSDFMANNISFALGKGGYQTTYDCHEIKDNISSINQICTNSPGYFSVYNSLAALATARVLGISYSEIKKGLERISIKGRMENVPINADYSVIIDYAHNALSVKNLMNTINLYKPKRIISVFGSGGNRDKERRFQMGEIIGKYSDISIITADNSRFEKVDSIIDDIMVGMKRTESEHIIITDRKKAIEYAMDIARIGDVILLIGKGHEDYEEVNGIRTPFSERDIVINYNKSKK